MTIQTEEEAEAALREAFPDAEILVAWRVGSLAQMSADNDSVVRDTFEDALAYLIAKRLKRPVAEPAAEAVAEPVVEAAPEPEPEPEPDTRDAELEVLRARIEALEDAKRELEARELELKDANATLKDALSDIEDRIADLDDEDDAPPAPEEHLSDLVGVSDTERGVLKTAMEEGESVSAAKRRLYPILNEELSRLQNQEALLGASTPESVSARRKEVESLLGILARVGDA